VISGAGSGAATAESGRRVAVRWLIPAVLGLSIALAPVPHGLAPNGWRYFALFVFVVSGLVTEPVPGAVMGLLGVSIGAGLGLVGKTPAESLKWALSGFSNDVVWLIVLATTFALGYELTGLGRRVALFVVNRLGGRTLGLGYAIALADLVLAPFMPSNTARSAGTIYPVVRNIPPLYGSHPADRPRAIGGYLCWTAFASTCVTSAMFPTAMAPNLLAIEMARTIAHVDVTWASWVRHGLPVGALLFLLTPVVTYLIYPPSITRGREVAEWAGVELRQMGAISGREMTMGVLAVAALGCWIGASKVIAPATVGLAVVLVMMLARVVTWNDIASHAQAWNVLVWFATLVALADGLSQVGFLSWFAGRSVAWLAGTPVTLAVIGIVTLFFLIHYVFASTTAHTTAVLPVFLAAVVAIPGLPVKAVVLTLLYSIGLMGVLTPYATGPAPVWYASGYIRGRDYWKLGAIMGMLYLAALLAIGVPYLRRFVP
jgi:L-tartrate/succinate antiporter